MLIVRLNFEFAECEEDDLRAQQFNNALDDATISDEVPAEASALAQELFELDEVMVIDKRKADVLVSWLKTLPGYAPEGHPFQPFVYEEATQSGYEPCSGDYFEEDE